MVDKKSFKLKVRDTQKIIFEGEVDRISSFNDVGPFDVYPTHANFISIIKKELSVFQNKQKIREIKLEQAVLKVKKDVAKVFLGIEVISLEDKIQITDNSPAKK